MIRYLDSSAHSKAYIEEDGSGDVRGWMRRDVAWISRLGLVEVHSALVRQHRSGHLGRGDLARAVRALESDSRRLGIIELDEDVAARACLLLRDHPLRGADAVHLASAMGLQDRVGTVILASWDGQMLRAASALGIVTVGP